jgi:hypothetical protein
MIRKMECIVKVFLGLATFIFNMPNEKWGQA